MVARGGACRLLTQYLVASPEHIGTSNTMQVEVVVVMCLRMRTYIYVTTIEKRGYEYQ